MKPNSIAISTEQAPESPVREKGVPKLGDLRTLHKSKKLWITPDNEIIPLSSWHYDFFSSPVTARKYGVVFRDEETTRLDALRVGFVRANYEINGGLLTLETMRWDRALRKVVDRLVLENADSIDLVRCYLLSKTGTMVQLGCASLMDMRRYEKPINRLTLGSWNNFRITTI